MKNNRKINDFERIYGFKFDDFEEIHHFKINDFAEFSHFKFDDFVVFYYYKINDFGVNKLKNILFTQNHSKKIKTFCAFQSI